MRTIRSPFLAGIAMRLRAAAAETQSVTPERAPHPTRRADGRTPNPGAAETAIAAAIGALIDAPDVGPARPPSRRS